METRFGFFPYGALDFKAAQAYLDRKAAQGWVLKRLWLGFLAQFEPGNGRRHYVDICSYGGFGPDYDYTQLLSDAGWELVSNRGEMALLRTLPGVDPVPIQSDPAFEWREFLRKYVRWRLIFVGAYLLLHGAALAIGGSSPFIFFDFSSAPASTGVLLLLLCYALILPVLVWELCHAVRYLLRCRAAGALVSPGDRSVRVKNTLGGVLVLFLIISLCFAGFDLNEGKTVDLHWQYYNNTVTAQTATAERCREYPVVTALDLALTDPSYRDLEGHRSPFMEFLDYREIVDEGALHVERYDCANEGLARWVTRRRKRETSRENSFLWGAAGWQETPGLGFDESYTCRQGSCLLLRQGNVVTLVSCGDLEGPVLDLTTPEHLALLRARLRL